MATNFVAKLAKLAYPPSFSALASHNELEYRNDGDDLTTSYKNLVNVGPVTLEFTRLNCSVQQASIVI